MSPAPAAEASRALAERVEAFCRHYLSNGHRSGGYWIVGDTGNSKGRSLFIRLTGPPSGKGARGRWSDAATGEYGDLLDLLAAREGYRSLGEALNEARRFLGQPDNMAHDGYARDASLAGRYDTSTIARLIWGDCRSVACTLAETYLRGRCLEPPYPGSLRFHPALEYRDHATGEITHHPALVVAIRDISGTLRGIQRLWLGSDGRKAVLTDPRRSLGAIHGHGVWLRQGGDPGFEVGEPASGTILIGEGVETVLSLGGLIPETAVVAALSASHLAGFIPPAWVRYLLIARDADPAGLAAARRLERRAADLGIRVTLLRPVLKDFNTDLRLLGRDVLAGTIQRQLPERVQAGGR